MLAGTAGFAAAEVAVSGYAEMGILTVTGEGGASNTQFHQDVDVTFTMSGETDGGLAFGTSVDLDEANALDNADTPYSVFISGAFGKMTMGDTDGALDWAVADAGSLTSMGDDHTTHIAYFSANGFDGSHDGQIVRYEYSMGDFGVALSYEQAANGAASNEDDNVGIGATYSMDMSGTAVKVGLGYQSGTVDADLGTGVNFVSGDVTAASVSVDMASGFSAVIGYSTASLDGAANDVNRTGVGLTYTSGPLAVTANYGSIDAESIVGTTDSYGLAANYDLGGGAVVMVGYGSDVAALPGNQSQWSAGLGLSF
jgi:outer membrane protein OmpU